MQLQYAHMFDPLLRYCADLFSFIVFIVLYFSIFFYIFEKEHFRFKKLGKDRAKRANFLFSKIYVIFQEKKTT